MDVFKYLVKLFAMSFMLQLFLVPIIWLFWGITLEVIIKGTWASMVVYFIMDSYDNQLPWYRKN